MVKKQMLKAGAATLAAAMMLAGCSETAQPAGGTAAAASNSQAMGDFLTSDAAPFSLEKIQDFDRPWAMAFLPASKTALVSTRPGKLYLWTVGDKPIEIGGVPQTRVAGQGGLGDIVLAPDYAASGLVYFSYAARDRAGDENGARAVVASARLDLSDRAAPVLADVKQIWRQSQASANPLHYSHRIAFSPDGRYLFVTSGERALKDPAQDIASNLGKILRLNLDGSAASGNPFAGQGGASDQLWSIGHRNLLGIDFDRDGKLWNTEMGPAGGDELNLVQAGGNYGWPVVSMGDDYDGAVIADHPTRPEFVAPQIYWVPSVSPSSLMVVDGARYPGWQGKALIGGMSGQAIMLVSLDGGQARLDARWGVDWRVRGFGEASDGSIWVIEDGTQGGIYSLTQGHGGG